MSRFLNSLLLGAALVAPIAFTPTTLRAEDRKYHDAERNDDHVWNSHEDRAYRIYLKQNHRRYVNFERLKEEDRSAYWAWRHNHDDAALKIDIR
ncbi:MAG TPA: hypothetical protein VKT81_16540 [Bryobacteraceae bacterium]|nr:hypothetical protein [Bryobacteraceae bacterium]